MDERHRVYGLLPSDHDFDGFISPITNPFFFEDPRSLTEVRGIFLNNNFPADISGGNAQMYSAQFRGRLTDRLSVIAPNVGYFQVNQGSNSGAPVGLASTPIGVKYNFIRNVESQFLVSGGITY